MQIPFTPIKAESIVSFAARAVIAQQEESSFLAKHERVVAEMKEELIDKMDGNRFRVAYSLGKQLKTKVLANMLDDYTLVLAAEEYTNHADRSRRNCFAMGLLTLLELREKRREVQLEHLEAIQLSSELAMRLVPTYSDAALTHATLTLNQLWLEAGTSKCIPNLPPPRQTLSLKRQLTKKT